MTGLQVPEHINDDYFKKSDSKSADKSKNGIFTLNEKDVSFYFFGIYYLK